jgi:hypothetical protein
VQGGRNSIHQPQAVEPHQTGVGRERRVTAGPGVAEGDEAVRGGPALRRDGLGEARQIRRLAQERRRRDETAQPLASAHQPFLDQPLDGARDREPADLETFGEYRLAVDALARPLAGDLPTQSVDELQVERAIKIGAQCGRHADRPVVRLTGQVEHETTKDASGEVRLQAG